MKNHFINIIRSITKKIIKRDFIIINQFSTIKRIPGMMVISESHNGNGYLPVCYNYHTPEKWYIKYDIFGNTCGTLHFSLKAPGKEPFLEITSDVRLPQTWILERDGQSIKLNGKVQEIRSAVPLDTKQLFGDFKYVTGDIVLFRKVGHRVKLENGSLNQDYFNGNVYRSYDDDSSHFPPEILDKIKRYHNLEGRLLDVGCATGLLVSFARKHGLEAEGIDISEWAVQRANEKNNGVCRALDFDKVQVSDFSSSYDIITLNSVLEHLENPKHALELLYELCNSNGVVYIQTLNSDSLMHQILKSDWGGYTDYSHKSPEITAKWLISTAQSIGFIIEYEHKSHIWNDNTYDDIWQAFSSMLTIDPFNTLLEEKYGDVVEVILRHP